MTTPTDPRDDQARIPQQQPQPARRRWTWIVAAVVAALAIAGGTTYALAGGGKDPGVVACERAADRAAAGKTSDSSDDGDVQMLKDSKHADLREVGDAIEGAADGDLSDVMQVGVQMMAACARHGVVIDPS